MTGDKEQIKAIKSECEIKGNEPKDGYIYVTSDEILIMTITTLHRLMRNVLEEDDD